MKKNYLLILLFAILGMGSTMAAEEFGCTITLTDISAYGVTVRFTPEDNSQYYICSVSTKAAFDYLGEDYITDYYKQTMDDYIAEDPSTTYKDFAHVGEYEYTNSKLSPQTEYVVFAYSINPSTGRATSAMKVYEFTTPKDTPDETDVYLHIVSPHWVDKVETAGFWQITGWTEDYDHYVQFCADPATAKTGTFTLGNTSWDWDYTGVYYYSAAGTFPTKRYCDAMTLVISIENDVVKAKCDYLDDRGVTYHITFDDIALNSSGTEGESYDMTTNVVANFSANECHQKYDADETCFYVWCQNADNEYFEAKLYTPGNTLEDGVYTLTDVSADFTAEPCSSDGSSIYGTVYGTLTEDGYMNSPWFWCIEGTVTVSHDAQGVLQLYTEATNTWGKTAKVSVNGGGADGIDAVITKEKVLPVRKSLQNGNVIIEKNGRKFNALGVEVRG